MTQYWHDRLQEALSRSRSTSSPAVREIHLRTAEHYRSLANCAAAPRYHDASTVLEA